MIFIVGVGRSGTSLLQSILNAHSKVAFLPETQFLRKYVLNPYHWNGKSRFIKTLKEDTKYNRIGLYFDEEISSPLEYYKALNKHYLDRKGKDYIGDKDPKNIEYIEELCGLFDSPLIVHIVRDPRDVILSRTKADWSKKWPVFLHAYVYEVQILNGLKKTGKMSSENIVTVNYEDLLRNPRLVLSRILDKVGLEFEEEMHLFYNTSEELFDNSETQWKKETLKPIIGDNINKWKGELSVYQIALIEEICRKSMRINNYEISRPRLSILNILGVKLLKYLYIIFKGIYILRGELEKR